jgi:TatD DNase family protein
MKLFDAHNHLQDARLASHLPAILPELARLGVSRAVVNGTCEADWPMVADLARREAFVLPSFGLHPWSVAERTTDWLEALRAQLVAHPGAGVGEIGLDRWITGHDDAVQAEVFIAQLALAAELNRAATIHCIQAWGALAETLRMHPRPARGFLIHAYGGSAEMMREFVPLGGYFSFNAYFLHERKAEQRVVFGQIPSERLLVETDAPALPPPDEHNEYPLRDADGETLNHPANLALTYKALAGIRGVSVEVLATQVEENFARLFGR